MNRWLALAIAIAGGAVLATFLYQLVGLAAFGVTMLFGVDDELWHALEKDSATTFAVFMVVTLACWFVGGRLIWRWIRPKG
jgi:hypothetical protein